MCSYLLNVHAHVYLINALTSVLYYQYKLFDNVMGKGNDAFSHTCGAAITDDR